MKNRLKIGIVMDDPLPRAWEYTLIQQMLESKILDLECLLYFEEKQVPSSRIWQRHLNLDQAYFKPQPNAFEISTSTVAFGDLPKVKFENAACLKTLELDVLLWLSDKPLVEALNNYLSTGVLYFLHGARMDTSWAFLGYWEFIKKQEVIASTLVFDSFLTKERQIIYQTWSMMPSMSISRSRNEHAWKLTSLAYRALRILSEKGIGALPKVDYKETKESLSIRIEDNYPTLFQGIINLAKHFNRMLYKAFRKIAYREQWILLLDRERRASTAFKEFKKILPPKDRFWADPFLVKYEGSQYLFFEELPFATDKGHLSVLEIAEDGTLGRPTIILDKPYHLSYPFIFEKDGTYYMIPESYQDRTIQLYECKQFPFHWEHKMNIMEGVNAFDTTLYFHNDKWWLFTVLTEHQGGGHNDELFLFFSDTPFTQKWQAHPQNPIVSDVRRARPAGNIYKEHGKIIRPSQDCARKYGFGFNLNEIEVLTETDYQEKCILNIRPDWDQKLTRTHSFNHSQGMTVIDAVIQRSRFF